MNEKTEHGYAMLLLGKLLEAHEIPINPLGDWFLRGEDLPAIRCMWFRSESNKSGQLDIEVVVDEGVVIKESVAGVGADEDALQDAFYNLSASSLYVLLSAFWGKVDVEHVSVRPLDIDGAQYLAYVGNFGLRGSGEAHPGVPEDAVDQILDSLKTTNISGTYHWSSTFFCNAGNGEQIHSALLDNNSWDEGLAAMKSIKWTPSKSYYSVRHFLVLKKVPV